MDEAKRLLMTNLQSTVRCRTPAADDRKLRPSPRAALLLLMFFGLSASAEDLSVSVDCFEADIAFPMNYLVELRVESDDDIVTITSYSELTHLIRTFACGESGDWLLTITKPTGELEYVVRFKPMEDEE